MLGVFGRRQVLETNSLSFRIPTGFVPPVSSRPFRPDYRKQRSTGEGSFTQAFLASEDGSAVPKFVKLDRHNKQDQALSGS